MTTSTCQRCGGPKPRGRGRRLCDGCLYAEHPTECAICGGDLPRASRPTKPRTICDRPECKSAAARHGAEILNRRRARRAREEGPPSERHCPQCDTTKPLTVEFFYLDKPQLPTHSSRRFDRWCRECRLRKARELRERRRDEINARRRERRAETRPLLTPEQLEAERAVKRAATARRRQRSPEKVKEEQRRSRERIKADPERHAAALEARRMQHRLRREQRDGIALGDLRVVGADERQDNEREALPSAPLAAFIDALAAREHADLGRGMDTDVQALAVARICERAGISDRLLRAWRLGERPTVPLERADAVLVGLDVLWWEVWTEETVRRPLIVTVRYRRVRRTLRDGTPASYREVSERRTYGDGGPDMDALEAVRRAWEGDTEAAAA